MPLIAVIDDRATNRTILAKLAASLGKSIAVRGFSDPREALDWAAETTPDLVITDFKMPSMDGAEFIKEFRTLPMSYDVPIIVVTVYEDKAFRYRALDAGATDFLISPFDHREFRTRVHNLLILRRQQEIIRRRAFSLEERLILTNQLREEETRQSRERLSTIIDTVPVMIFAVDRQQRCTMANSRFCEFFSMNKESAVGQDLREIIGGAWSLDQANHDAAVFDQGTSREFEEGIVDRFGAMRTFLTTKVPLRDNPDDVSDVVTVSLDITDRKEAERVLIRAKQTAEAASLTKTQFIANTSHELRTPLNAIIGFAEILETELYGPLENLKYKQYVGDILTSARHLLNLINDILDVSRIESGQLELSEGKIDLPRSIESVVRLIRSRAEDSEVDVSFVVAPKIALYADERRVKQILLNVVANAVGFTPPGGKVRIEGWIAEDNGIRIRVVDTGIGIPAREIPTAISRFGRVNSSSSLSRAGTGLGLPLSIDLMQLHGGEIDIESTIGKGTTVTVKFPATRTIYKEN